MVVQFWRRPGFPRLLLQSATWLASQSITWQGIMTAKGSKSRKPFVASSRSKQQPSDVTFFLDRCLGCHDVPDALRAAGIHAEIHRDHFESRCRDDVWLPEVGKRGWAVVTKDERFRSRQFEIAALMRSGSPTFVLSSGNTTGSENARAILIAMPQMLKLIDKQPAPFIAKISAAGILRVVLTQGDLLKRVQ